MSNNKAEIQSYAFNQSGYDQGTWEKSDEGYILSFSQNNVIYRIKEQQGLVLSLSSSKFKTNRPWSTVFENWLLVGSRKIEKVNYSFEQEPIPLLVIEGGINYPKKMYRDRNTGKFEIKFDLAFADDRPKTKLYKPINVAITSSTIEKRFADEIISEFSKYRYANPVEMRGILETISLDIIDDIPSVKLSRSTTNFIEAF